MGTTVVIKVCAVCGKQLFGESFHPARPLSELEPLCLKAQDEDAFLRLPHHLQSIRCVYTHTIAGHTKYFHLHPDYVCVRGESVTVDVCTNCYNSLYRPQPRIPTYSIAAGYDFGRPSAIQLPELSTLEQTVIALNIRYMRIFKLTGAGQVALQGHMIALPHNSPHILAEQLPRTNLSQHLRIAFVGDAAHYCALLDDPAARQQLFQRFQTVKTQSDPTVSSRGCVL
jgi:hypothetical protein